MNLGTPDVINSLVVLGYVLTVMAVVVVVLMTLKKLGESKASSSGGQAPALQASSGSPKALGASVGGDELIAVLAAAANEALGRAVVIRSIQLVKGAGHETWAIAGRADVMHSHRVGPPR